MSPDLIIQALTTLQAHALEKLTSISQFKQTGLATLRIKVAGPNQQTANIQMQLTETGEALKNRILGQISVASTSRYIAEPSSLV